MPGRNGPKPLPTALKLVTGNAGKRALPKNEAKPAAARPAPPATLNADGVEEWHRVIDGLFKVGLMTSVDRPMLAAYCDAYSIWVKAGRALAEMENLQTEGLMILTKNGNPIQNPIVGTLRSARADMARYAAEFGMSPASRTRIQIGIPSDSGNIGDPDEEAANKFFR
jgi:P27 family predicted phage terminase small subunit